MEASALERFSAATHAWFAASYAAPTAAQEGAWSAIASGEHALVVAPTGSGKTLAAFLWALDRLATTPPPEPARRCRVLYISPLKALANDVERNLQRPLAGIAAAAAELGSPMSPVRVAIRSGDTPSAQRRSFTRQPPDILITTPESLFLLLTSAARSALAGIETVIVDEIHAVAGTKRGAHLALSLERLDALLERPAQRIGLSATVRPVAEVARFLAGGRPVKVVDPPLAKRWELSVVVPFPDLADLDRGTETATSSSPELRSSTSPDIRRSAPSLPSDEPAQARLVPRASSVWPRIEERIVDEIAAHTSTLVFVNSRRLAERLTARLNELWLERLGDAADVPGQLRDWATHDTVGGARRAPAEVMAQSAISEGAPAVLARAHHGSVSREEREQIETDLKSGRLAAVVATSSLELGIDMGAIDLVIQVEAPPSVAAGLQRVGRAGHQVGAVSKGLLFPKFRGDLVQTAVAVERMRAGQIEQLRVPSNPLDVLAQQLVAMVALEEWSVDAVETLVRRAAPFAGLTRAVLEAVLDMLAGRYPAEEFAELRPRLVWDRATDTLTGRRGAQRLAVISGGTIPDRGLYPVYLAGAEAGGRRVGELDEEMVYESRVGDVIALGTTSWRIESISQQQVEVSPAPGQAARLPFWKGDALGRPAELGRAVGGFVREISTLAPEPARARLAASGLDQWAIDNLLAYLDDQTAATGVLPHDRQLVIERFRDELGDWRVIVHSPFGAQVHAPWALIAAARLRERYGVDVQAMHADDGMLFRLPAGDPPEALYDPHQGHRRGRLAGGSVGATDLGELTELLFPEPEDVTVQVTAELGGSALFAARFRECAGRSLLLPRQRPGRRQALWQQRLRSSQLLQIASGYPEFPIVAEAVRECLHDVYDVPALVELLGDVRARRVAVRSVETVAPSPFASSLLFGYVAQFLYENDSPLAERRAAALSVDPGLLADLLGSTEATALADLLDPDVLTAVEAELQQLAAGRRARDADELSDLLRRLGPLTVDQLAARCVDPGAVTGALASLAGQARAYPLPDLRWASAEDAGRLRDGLGVPPPSGLPDPLLAPVADPLGDLLTRYARSHAPFTDAEAARWLGLGVAVVREQLQRLVAIGRLVAGDLRPPGWEPVVSAAERSDRPARGGGELGAHAYCDPDVLRRLRRRSLAALREAVEPVSGPDYARFLPDWQGVGRLRGTDGVLRVVEQLAGLPVPASVLESWVLPSRVSDYTPALLDELTLAGEVRWQGTGALGETDGWISLHPSATAPSTLAEPTEPASPLASSLLAELGTGGHFFTDLVGRLDVARDELRAALWELVWSGWVSNDSLAPLRALLGSAGRQRTAPRARHRPALSSIAISRQLAPPEVAGRWSVLPARASDPTRQAVARAEAVLDRYGVVSRAAVAGENLPGGFAGLYRVLAAAEESGRVRRGYFIEGLGAAQFGTAGAIDALRTGGSVDQVLVLAATDPANAYGAALPWPAPVVPGHQPSRKAGALVVLAGGRLVGYLNGRSLLSFDTDSTQLARLAQAVAGASGRPGVGRLSLTKLDGEAAVGAAGPLVDALLTAGFALTPSGLRLPH